MVRPGDVAVSENRQPVTAAKFITKTLLFILLPGVSRRLEPKLIGEKVENTFVAPPYCQTAFYVSCIPLSLYEQQEVPICIGGHFTEP